MYKQQNVHLQKNEYKMYGLYFMDAIKAKSVEIHIIELFKSMSNVQKVLQVIEKG